MVRRSAGGECCLHRITNLLWTLSANNTSHLFLFANARILPGSRSLIVRPRECAPLSLILHKLHTSFFQQKKQTLIMN